MNTKDAIKKFLQNDEIITILFDEVPPYITLGVLYLEPVDGNVFTLKTANLHLVRLAWKSDTGEIVYGYFKNPDDAKSKVTNFLEQFENIENVWLQEERYCGTRYIDLRGNNH